MPTPTENNRRQPEPDEPSIRADDVIEALDRLGVKARACPACGQEGRTGFGSSLQIMDAVPNSVMTALVVVCSRCGFVRQFDNGVLKVPKR
jgi:hypothetical protein